MNFKLYYPFSPKAIYLMYTKNSFLENGMLSSSILRQLATGPPPAAHACPLGLKRHSRREDAIKEGRCIRGGKFFKKVDTMTDILCAL